VLLLSVFALLGVGCQGLTPGKAEWVQPYSAEPRAGNVYLIRGLIGVFSTGMDDLSAKIQESGVRAHVFQDNQHSYLANAIVQKYKGVKDPEPLVLIGHSYGADDVMRVAHVLKKHNIKVDLAVTFDATTPPSVPPNVETTYNYYQSQVTDVIPLFRGIALKPEEPGNGKLVNVDLRKDRKDLLESGTNHINIDKNTRIHTVVVEHVLEACPPRPQWAARYGVPTPIDARTAAAAEDDAQRASNVVRAGQSN
jgi:hypothetical protein